MAVSVDLSLPLPSNFVGKLPGASGLFVLSTVTLSLPLFSSCIDPDLPFATLAFTFSSSILPGALPTIFLLETAFSPADECAGVLEGGGGRSLDVVDSDTAAGLAIVVVLLEEGALDAAGISLVGIPLDFSVATIECVDPPFLVELPIFFDSACSIVLQWTIKLLSRAVSTQSCPYKL